MGTTNPPTEGATMGKRERETFRTELERGKQYDEDESPAALEQQRRIREAEANVNAAENMAVRLQVR